jgi:hypothetical protein
VKAENGGPSDRKPPPGIENGPCASIPEASNPRGEHGSHLYGSKQPPTFARILNQKIILNAMFKFNKDGRWAS